MKIVVMGSGGVGGFFGGKLAASGEDVTFIARGAHLKAIQKTGLVVKSPTGDFTAHPVSATDDPTTLGGPADIVMVCVKLWDVEEAGEKILPVIGPETTVIPFQNGVDGPERLAAILGQGPVMAGVAHISAVIEKPGIISHNGPLARIFFGERDGGESPRGTKFLAVCEKAGIKARLSTNINQVIWEKFIFLVAFSGMTAMTRGPIGPIRDDPEKWAMFKAAMMETVELAHAKGVTFKDDPVEGWLPKIENMPGDYRASMLEDLERGNRLELPWLSGAVVRLGAASGIETPANGAIVEALAPFIDGL
ncbi:MAG: 2-dehydropantoate 2-reductase [Rhodospirillaceae bacterium]|jgi:2-dehydropantoate 2-reductase|nr:2-dehydropantoate 2-reductase [Rhodospirillaceae bacterium]MBT5374344.1 2-dehydropantoate 2-reductase [Rhodospirillaceae bacterium]MBT5752428.1 2-dehydropantoate 2-reductase [Rhodospirillaceae bacterium]